VIRAFFEVFDLLFAVEHEPALDAQDFSVGLGLDDFELADEVTPLS
jgi:hypothetical protein